MREISIHQQIKKQEPFDNLQKHEQQREAAAETEAAVLNNNLLALATLVAAPERTRLSLSASALLN